MNTAHLGRTMLKDKLADIWLSSKRNRSKCADGGSYYSASYITVSSIQVDDGVVVRAEPPDVVLGGCDIDAQGD
jgi:hypothetical protein